MSEPFISVIIPTYKPQNYIHECLQCLIKQTLASDFFEVIVVLNGYKDPYFDDIYQHIKGERSFSLLYSATAGVSNARNIGLEFANGSHIVFIDDDDFVSPTFLEKMYTEIKRSYTSIIAANFLRFVDDRWIKDDYMTDSYRRLLTDESKFRLFRYRKVLSSACGKAIPVGTIMDTRFREDVKISEDALFLFEISKNITNIVLCQIDVVYYRRVRSSSASRKMRSIKEWALIFFKNVGYFSIVYFRGITRYNFLFYLSRILAVSRHFIIHTVKTRR